MNSSQSSFKSSDDSGEHIFKTTGSQKKNHYFEVFVNYRFYDSFR